MFLSLIQHISEGLAPKRNRYVHDYWTVQGGTLEKMDRRASVKKSQSFQPPQLVFNTWQATPPGEVDDLANLVTMAAIALHASITDLSQWKREGSLQRSVLQSSQGLWRAPPAVPRSEKKGRTLPPRSYRA